MKNKMSLEERMNFYESRQKRNLIFRLPIIMRIDGRAFHTFTKDFERPFDDLFIDMMNTIGLYLCENVMSVKMAYLQSDEINLLIYQDNPESMWFDNNEAKLLSITSSLASAVGMKWLFDKNIKKGTIISFDSRIITLPKEEVINYFIWRQNDWNRNSLQMLARKYFSHHELTNKKKAELHECIFKAGDNWNNLPDYLRRGRCVVKKETIITVDNEYFFGPVIRKKWKIDNEIPIFSSNRDYITQHFEVNHD